MPLKARSYCLTPACPNLSVYKGRCQDHARVKERERGSAAERGYTSQWAAASRAFRAAHPICGELHDGSYSAEHSICIRENRSTAATCVDHIRSVNDGGEKFDPANLMSSCWRCNTVKSNRIDGRRRT